MNAELSATIKAVQRSLGGLAVDGIAGPKTWAAIAWKVSGENHPQITQIHTDSGENNQRKSAQSVDENSVDLRSEQNIATLLPDVQRTARAFLRAVNNTLRIKFTSPVTVRMINGTRTRAEQDALYAHGRTAPGPIVTKARGGYSNHNFGIAFDIGVFGPDSHYYPEHAAYDVAGEVGKSFGLAWGGDWVSFQDKPHFELRPLWARELPEAEMMVELRRRTTRGEAVV